MDEILTNDITEEVTGEEVQEPAVPAVEGEEGQEPAAPVSEKSDADKAFAEMRRQLAEAKAEAETAANERDAFKAELGRYFAGDDPLVSSRAYAEQRSEADIRAEIQRENEIAQIRAENKAYRERAMNAEIELTMENDLREIQKIDPSVKSLDELGNTFRNLIATGCDAISAYYADKARSDKERITPATPPGEIKAQPGEKDFFTRDEVEKMSEAEVKKNYGAIRKSMNKW